MSATAKTKRAPLGERSESYSLHTKEDLDPLLERIGDSRLVLLGEASHGTSEYYLWRMRISQRLILERGFSFIAVEGDWPDCYRVNRYIKGLDDTADSARDVLRSFVRWPTWMWANWEVAALVDWLRSYNQTLLPPKKVGFYGVDVYSLWESLQEITQYLEKVDPSAVAAAKRAYRCFEPFQEDPSHYALTTRFVPAACEGEVLRLLTELRQKMPSYQAQPGDGEAAFNAEQNAQVAIGAERYYRAMLKGGPESWNIRDIHMADTLERLISFYGEGAKGIIWEHNTHIGDARATDMARAGMVNVGELVRRRRAKDGVVLVGFGSYQGSVIAGAEWSAPMEMMLAPKARAGSWEEELHQRFGEDTLLLFPNDPKKDDPYAKVLPHRAIGVVYDPANERWGNYVPTSLSHRYDAFLYLEKTNALHPLHLDPEAHLQPPETFPWAV